MSDLLQRLVKRARDGVESTGLCIEPLLTPRYAPARAAADANGLHEMLVETVAPAGNAADVAPSPIAMHASREHVRDQVAASMPERHARQAAHPAGATPTTASPVEPVHATSGENTSSIAPSTHADAVRVEHTIKPALQTVTRAAPPYAAMARNADGVRTQPATLHETPAIEETTQTITISIGRVEVRNAPASASVAPRRPAFRPAVSLDAFLKRGGGDER